MGWEKRGDNLYYYRKRRKGVRVYSEYIGTAELVNAMIALERLWAMDEPRPRRKRKQKRVAAFLMGSTHRKTW